MIKPSLVDQEPALVDDCFAVTSFDRKNGFAGQVVCFGVGEGKKPLHGNAIDARSTGRRLLALSQPRSADRRCVAERLFLVELMAL